MALNPRALPFVVPKSRSNTSKALNPAAGPQTRSKSRLNPRAIPFVAFPQRVLQTQPTSTTSNQLNAQAASFLPTAQRLALVPYVDPVTLVLATLPQITIKLAVVPEELSQQAEDLAQKIIHQPASSSLPLRQTFVSRSIPLLCMLVAVYREEIFMALTIQLNSHINEFYDQFEDEYEEMDDSSEPDVSEYDPAQPMLFTNGTMINRPGFATTPEEWDAETVFPEDEASPSANIELNDFLTELPSREPVRYSASVVFTYSLFLATQDGWVLEVEAQVQENEHDTIYIDERHFAHHQSFIGLPVYCKTATDPALSLAIINAMPKGAMSQSEKNEKLHIPLLLNNAFQHVDPVIFFGRREELLGLTTAEIREKACGQVSKFYAPIGAWQFDEYDQDEDEPLQDVYAPEYCSENFTIYNGLMNNVGQPDRFEFRHMVELNFASEHKEYEMVRRVQTAPFHQRTFLDPEHKPLRASTLSRAYTPDSMLAEEDAEQNDILRPTTKSWADLDEEDNWDATSFITQLSQDNIIADEVEEVLREPASEVQEDAVAATCPEAPDTAPEIALEAVPGTITVKFPPEALPCGNHGQPLVLTPETPFEQAVKICLICATHSQEKLIRPQKLAKLVRCFEIPTYMEGGWGHKSCAVSLTIRQLRHKRRSNGRADVSTLAMLAEPRSQQGAQASTAAVVHSEVILTEEAISLSSAQIAIPTNTVDQEISREDIDNESLSPVSTLEIQRLVSEAVAASSPQKAITNTQEPETPTKSRRSISETLSEAPKAKQKPRSATFTVFADQPFKKLAPPRMRTPTIPRSEGIWDLAQAFKDAKARKENVKRQVETLSEICEEDTDDVFLDIANKASTSSDRVSGFEVVHENVPITVKQYKCRQARVHVLTPIKAASPSTIIEEVDEDKENTVPASPTSP